MTYRNQIHTDGTEHNHNHPQEHSHVHMQPSKANLTPRILITIFIFSPYEPLIPLLMYPTAQNSFKDLALVTAVFGGAIIATMMAIILIPSFGIKFLPLQKIERYSHALAGFTVLAWFSFSDCNYSFR